MSGISVPGPSALGPSALGPSTTGSVFGKSGVMTVTEVSCASCKERSVFSSQPASRQTIKAIEIDLYTMKSPFYYDFFTV